MTKFEELCGSFGDARNSWFEYRDKCQNFGAGLVARFLKYLEMPDSASIQAALPKEIMKSLDVPERLVTWAKLDGERKPVPAAVFDAIRLEQDGFWHATFMITVYERPDVFPYQKLLLEFAFKPSGADFRVRLSEDGPEIVVSEDKPDTFDGVHKALFSRMQEYFRDSTDWEKGHAPRPRKIGFTSGER
jgi:hypothetical protein